jgi:archaellum component FlaC
MVNLNETASKYLDENSVEKGFGRFEKEIESQLDAFCADLERELQNSLKNQYPKLKSALKESHDSTNHENKDIAKMKANVRNYMSSMLVQMHNDIW